MCFFFNDTATTEIYTLSLHDALPISQINTPRTGRNIPPGTRNQAASGCLRSEGTRLNSSHVAISYAVFCLKKKNDNNGNEPGGEARRYAAARGVAAVAHAS